MQWTLRALRKNFSLTAKEVADAVGVHHQTLLKYEKDSTNIPLNLANDLSNFYRVSLNDIFLGRTYELKRKIIGK